MNENINNEYINNDKLQIIISYIIKQKLKLEYKKDEYQHKNFWLLLSNMVFNTANTLLISFTNYDNTNVNNIIVIKYITFIFAFICAIFSYLMKILNYEKYINTYKQYLNDCNGVIYEYTNLITINKNNDEKILIIKNILDGYEKILKFNSELDTIRLNNIDELTYNDMISEFNDLLKINYKSVNRFIKKKNITIQSNTPPSNNSNDNNYKDNNKIILDILSNLTKNKTLFNIPNNTHETIHVNNDNKTIYGENNISNITKNNNVDELNETINLNFYKNENIINENDKLNIIINNNKKNIDIHFNVENIDND